MPSRILWQPTNRFVTYVISGLTNRNLETEIGSDLEAGTFTILWECASVMHSTGCPSTNASGLSWR